MPANLEKSLSRVKSVAPCSSNRCDQSIDGRNRNAFRSRSTKNGRCFSIRRKSPRFEHVPLRQIVLEATDVTLETLQNFRDHNSSEGEGLSIGDHAAQFGACKGRGRAEKIDPNRTVDQNQTRFL